MRYYISIFIVVIIGLSCKAQLDNSLFYEVDTIQGSKNDLYIKISSLSFNKNDEYYSSFANGQTFFGYNLHPELEYYFSSDVKVNLGLFVWKDFGNSKYTRILPTYTVEMKHGKNDFLFGNIHANLNHRYIEPLFDFNKLVTVPVEYGFQYLINGDKLKGDVWVDWQKMIYEGSPFEERIIGGATFNYTLKETDKIKIDLPLQYIMNHSGGQIDTISNQLKLAGNGAYGLNFTFKNKGWIDEISTQNYLVFWEDYFENNGTRIKNGNGVYLNVNLKHKDHNLMFSYWQGNGYQGIVGGPVYMSESISYKRPGEFSQKRQLLFVRFISNYKIADGVEFSLRLEPYYDFSKTMKQTFTNGIFEFSNGLYIQLNKKFFAGNLKSKNQINE